MKLPETNRCCFYCPLRWGIIFFGYINMIFSIMAAFSLAVTIEFRQKPRWDPIETTGAFLFAIFGMSVILSILLLFATYQKDKIMLRLYNSYAVGTALAVVIPGSLLLYMQQYIAAAVAFFGIAMQFYAVILVRSEVLKLDRKTNEVNSAEGDARVDVSDRETLV